MQFQKILLIVEDTAAQAEVHAGNILNGSVGDQIGVQLGAHFCNQAAQLWPVFFRFESVHILIFTNTIEVTLEDRQFIF